MTVQVVRFTLAGEHVADREAPRAGERGRLYTVVYDGHCKVCGRMVKVLAKWDRDHRLEIIPSQQPGVRERFPWIPSRSYEESMQVVRTSDGKTWQAAAALEELLKALPKGRMVSWLFKIPLVRPLVDVLYRSFARNRYRFGCGEHCSVRPPDLDYHDGDSAR